MKSNELTLKNGIEYLSQFCCKYDYPSEAIECFEDSFKTLCKNDAEFAVFISQIALYEEEHKRDFTAIFEEQVKIAKKIGIHPFTLQMLYLIFLTPHLKELYTQNGYSDFVFDSSVLDLKWKLFECKKVYNIWGIFVAWWTIGFFTLGRFGMGRLQFNPRPCPYTYENGDLIVHKNDITLDTHIPSSGHLLREEYLESYRLAEEFFSSHFVNRPTIFNCHSWLLSPENEKFLPKNSRILEFARDYTIIDSKPDPTNSNSWRIFNTMKQYENPEDYPQENTLQKAVVEWLKKGNNIGQGYGLIFYKNGKILNKG